MIHHILLFFHSALCPSEMCNLPKYFKPWPGFHLFRSLFKVSNFLCLLSCLCAMLLCKFSLLFSLFLPLKCCTNLDLKMMMLLQYCQQWAFFLCTPWFRPKLVLSAFFFITSFRRWVKETYCGSWHWCKEELFLENVSSISTIASSFSCACITCMHAHIHMHSLSLALALSKVAKCQPKGCHVSAQS